MGCVMPDKKLVERIKQGELFLDGAMGTQLFERGAKAGVCNDHLNLESPEMVTDVHCAYLKAGSDAIITNTFGGTSIAASWIWAPALFVSVQLAYEKGIAGIFWFTIPNVKL